MATDVGLCSVLEILYAQRMSVSVPRVFTAAAAGLALLGVSGCVLVWFASRWLLFPAPLPPPRSAAEAYSDVEVWWVDSSSGPATEAWFLPGRGDGALPVLVFAHGNGELIDYWVSDFERPRDWGMHILLVEYPGYGRSRGSPSEKSVRETFRAAVQRVLDRPDVDSSKLVLLGRSLGGAAVMTLVDELPPAALVLESSFTSVPDIAEGLGFPRFLVRDAFDSLSVLKSFAGPALIVHGRQDAVIPFSHGERLAAASASAELVALDCGHNDCGRDWKRIESFLQRAGVLHD